MTSLSDLDVSRETIQKFEIYFELLKEWNKAVPLVQEKTLDDFVQRHVIDSLQIIPLLRNRMESSIIDLGTGAGFPGLVLALYGFENITLVDSNRKKTLFLSEVARKTSTQVTIKNERAEKLTLKYDFVLSRACTSLSNLLSLMKNVSRETTTGIFHKGEKSVQEIKEAKDLWDFEYELIPSIIDQRGKIIIVRNVSKKYG